MALRKGIQTPMAPSRSTKIISMIEWIRIKRFPMKNSHSEHLGHVVQKEDCEVTFGAHDPDWCPGPLETFPDLHTLVMLE